MSRKRLLVGSSVRTELVSKSDHHWRDDRWNRRQDSPPIVGSLFSWKSLLTNRRTREDCGDGVRHDGIVGCGDALAYLSYGSLSEEDQLDAAGRLRTVAGISHLV